VEGRSKEGKERVKEFGPTAIAEGAITNPIQSLEDDYLKGHMAYKIRLIKR
jgi:hypothetical protein